MFFLWEEFTGMVWYMYTVWPGEHVLVYGMAWWASHGVWYGLAGLPYSMAWWASHGIMVWPGGPHMVYSMAWQASYGIMIWPGGPGMGYGTVQLVGFFNFPPIPVGRLICPLQSHSRLHSTITCNFMIFTMWSPCVSTRMGGITGGCKMLIHSTQVKQGKVHRILSPLCNPTQNSTEKYLCFHCSVSFERVESLRGKFF